MLADAVRSQHHVTSRGMQNNGPSERYTGCGKDVQQPGCPYVPSEDREEYDREGDLWLVGDSKIQGHHKAIQNVLQDKGCHLQILSIDQSMAASGWAILEQDGDTIHITGNGVVRTKLNKKDPANVGRIEEIYKEFLRIIDSIHGPLDAIVIERFFSKSYQGTLAVAEVRGIIKLLSGRNEVRLMEFAPQSVRKGLIGNGRAEKEDVAKFVKEKLNLTDDISLDETDAIAMGMWALGILKGEQDGRSETPKAGAKAGNSKYTKVYGGTDHPNSCACSDCEGYRAGKRPTRGCFCPTGHPIIDRTPSGRHRDTENNSTTETTEGE
jgi:crossover junction endodeoxyribonuclease RuvC